MEIFNDISLIKNIIGLWLRIFIPLSKLTYGAYLGGLSMQLIQVASMKSPTYYNDSLLVRNEMSK